MTLIFWQNKKVQNIQSNISQKYGQRFYNPKNFETKQTIFREITGRSTNYFDSPTFV